MDPVRVESMRSECVTRIWPVPRIRRRLSVEINDDSVCIALRHVLKILEREVSTIIRICLRNLHTLIHQRDACIYNRLTDIHRIIHHTADRRCRNIRIQVGTATASGKRTGRCTEVGTHRSCCHAFSTFLIPPARKESTTWCRRIFDQRRCGIEIAIGINRAARLEYSR